VLKVLGQHQALLTVLARAAVGSLLVKVLGAGLEFLLHVLLARALGVTGYGIYVYVFTWISVLAMMAAFGLDTAAIRVVASYKAHSEWPLLRGFLATAFRIVLINSTIVALLVLLLVIYVVDGKAFVFTPTFQAAVFLLPLMALIRLRQGVLRGLKHVVRAELPDAMLRPVLIAVSLMGVYYFHSGLVTAPAAMLCALGATMVAFLLGGFWLLQLLPHSLRKAKSVHDTKGWISIAFPLLFIAGMQLVLSQTDVIMLGAMLDPQSAGIYAATARIAGFVTFGLMAINAIAAPMIAEYHSLSNRNELQRLLTLAARGAFIFMVGVGAVLVIAGKFVLALFGNEFTHAYTALLILLAGETINAIAGSVGFLMTMTGHHVHAAIIFAGSAILNVLLNALLIPLFGVEGAAIATALTTALWNIVMLGYVQWRLGFNPTVFARYQR
jgi:O-antigen/teichoic acid export membrane protein